MEQISEENFRNLVDSSPAMLWVTRPDGYCTYLSKQWYDFTGRKLEDDLGLGWTENIHPDDREAAGTEFMRCSDEQTHYEVFFRLRRKDGVYRWVMDQGHPRYDDQGVFQGFVGTVIDIHDQRMAQQEIENIRGRFLRAAKAVDLGIWYCDLPFDQLIWNREVKNHFWLPEDVVVDINLFYERIHPADREKTQKAIAASIANNTHYQIIYRTTNPANPQEIKWIQAMGWTDYDVQGNPIRFDGITLDVSEEVQLRDNLMRALLVRDEFVSVASHELKTPLTGLQLQTQLLKKYISRGELQEDKLLNVTSKTESQVKKLTRLVDDMMDLSRIQTGRLTLHKEQVSLKDLMKEILFKLAPEFEKAEISIPVPEIPPTLVGFWDPLRLEQVLINLLTNAIRYGHQTPITISVEMIKNCVRISIEDEGPGIPTERMGRIFDRFERATSSNEVSGLGIGLYISKQIVQSHQGKIWVENKSGSGAKFIFELPL